MGLSSPIKTSILSLDWGHVLFVQTEVGTHPVIRGKQIVISMNFSSLKHTFGISTWAPNHETPYSLSSMLCCCCVAIMGSGYNDLCLVSAHLCLPSQVATLRRQSPADLWSSLSVISLSDQEPWRMTRHKWSMANSHPLIKISSVG